LEALADFSDDQLGSMNQGTENMASSFDPSSFLDTSKQVHIPVDDVHFWLGYFEQYLAAMERCLEDESATIRERYRDIPRERDNVLEALEGFFPDILRKSFFVAAYSLAEAELNERCRSVQKKDKLSLSLSDISGRGIKRARKYLEKVAGITFPDSLKPVWDELNNYRKLRNCFAHNQGWLRPNNRDDDHLRKQYIPSHQQHLYLEGDEITLRRGFCEEVIKTMRTFFQQLDKVQLSQPSATT
jgi:hypothetical protein